jgi:hypothetical protein
VKYGLIKMLTVLVSTIAVLAILATGVGVFWQGAGQPSEFRTMFGKTVMLHGHGLYRYDTVSVAAQAIAQDVVTLLVGIPLLIVALILFRMGSLRGSLLLAGTLAYFLYTYASYAFGIVYNVLFLVYVLLFALSLFAFILIGRMINIPTLSEHFLPHLPHRVIASFLFILSGFLLLNWLGLIGSALLANQPPEQLESYTTLTIQALDLGLVMPTAFLAGILLWRQRPWGYLLTSIMLIKGATLTLAVSAMVVNMICAGSSVNLGETIMFPTLTLISIGMTVTLLKHVSRSISPSA